MPDFNTRLQKLLESGAKIQEGLGTSTTPQPTEFFGQGYYTRTSDYDLNPSLDIENEAIYNSSRENKIITEDNRGENFTDLDDASWHDKIFNLDTDGKLIRKTVAQRSQFSEATIGEQAQENYERNRSIFGAIPILGGLLTGESSAYGYYPAKGPGGKYYLKRVEGSEDEMNYIGQQVMSAYGAKSFSNSLGTNLYKGISRTLNTTDKLVANLAEMAADLAEATENYRWTGEFKSNDTGETDRYAASLRRQSQLNDLTTSHAADKGLFTAEGFVQGVGSGLGSLAQTALFGAGINAPASALFKNGDAIRNLTMMGTGAILNTGEAYDVAKQNRLDEESAALFALGVGAVNTVVENAIGTNKLVEWLATGGSRVIPNTIMKELGGKITKEGLDEAVPRIGAQISKAVFSTPVVGQAAEEGIEEGLQALVSKTSEALYDQFAPSTATKGNGKFGADLTDKDTWAEIFGEGLIGAVTGAIGGVAMRKQNQTELDTIVPIVANGDAPKVLASVDMLTNRGAITPEQGIAYKERVNQLNTLYSANQSLFAGLDANQAGEIKGNALNAIEDEHDSKQQIIAFQQRIANIQADNTKSDAVKEAEITQIEDAIAKERVNLTQKTATVRQYLPDSKGTIPAAEQIKQTKPVEEAKPTPLVAPEEKTIVNELQENPTVIESTRAKDETIAKANEAVGLKQPEFVETPAEITQPLAVREGLESGIPANEISTQAPELKEEAIKTESEQEVEDTLPEEPETGKITGANAYERMQTAFPGHSNEQQLATNVGMLEQQLKSGKKPDLIVQKSGNHFNIMMVGVAESPLQVGYLAPTTGAAAPSTNADSLTLAAFDKAEAIKKAVANSKFTPDLDYSVRSSIDSGKNATGPNTTKTLLELEKRNPDGSPSDTRFMFEGSYTIYENKNNNPKAILGNFSEADINHPAFAEDGYVLKVKDPGGNTRFIGLHTTTPINADAFSHINSVIANNTLTDRQKTKELNNTIFIPSAKPDVWKTKFRVTKGDVYILATDATNPKKEVGRIRLPKQFNSFEDIIRNDNYSNKFRDAGLTIPDIITGLRSQIQAGIFDKDNLSGADKDYILSNLVPTTTEQLWNKVYVIPEGIKNIDAPVKPLSVVEDTPVTKTTEIPGKGKPIGGIMSADDAAKFINDSHNQEFTEGFKIDSKLKLQSTDFKKASKNIEHILPDFITVKNFSEIADRVYTVGSTLGAFFNDSIYLAEQSAKGIEYHEAFHGVFRRLLSPQERVALYRADKVPVTPLEIREFVTARPGLATLPVEQLRQLVLEERMADKFMEFMNNKPVGIFRRVFQYIKDFINWVTGNETELRALFAKIDSGAFRSSTITFANVGSQVEAFKLLPGTTSQESERIVNLVTTLYIRRKRDIVKNGENSTYYVQYKDKTTNEIVHEIIAERDAVESRDLEEFNSNTRLESGSLALLGIYEQNGRVHKIGYHPNNRGIVADQVSKTLQYFAVTDDVDSDRDTQHDRVTEQNDGSERNFDESSFEKGGFSFVDKDIKQFIALQSYVDVDGVEQVVDFFSTYSAMERRLSGIENWNEMLAQLRDLADGSPQIEAVYKDLLIQSKDLQIAFQQAFSKRKVEYVQVIMNEKTGEYQVFNANRMDVGDIQLSTFKINFDLLTEEAQIANAKAARRVVTNMKKDTPPATVANALATVGMTVTPKFISHVLAGTDPTYALGEVANKRNLRQDLDNILDLISQGKNPFIDDEKNSGAVARIKAVGAADALYRDDIINSNFQNAEGKNVYTYIQPSYVLVTADDIRNGKLDTRFAQDWYQENPLIKLNNANSSILPSLKLGIFNGVRETNGEGVTFKHVDAKTNIIAQHAMFKRNLISPFVFEAKSTSATIPIPEINRFYENSVISDQARDFLLSFVRQDKLMYEEALAQLSEMSDDELIENYHFKEYDANKKPIRLTQQEIEDAINTGKRASLPRAFQSISYPFLNSLTLADYNNRKAVERELLKFFTTSIREYKQLLKDNDIDIDTKNGVKLILNDKDAKQYASIDDYIGEYLLKDFIFSNAYAQLHRGNEAKYKDAVDITKRAAALVASGFPLLLDKPDFTVALIQDDFVYIDPTTMNRVDKSPDAVKVNTTDAQGWVSPRRFKDILKGLGRLSPAAEVKIDKLIAGEDIDWNPDEFVANSIKNVYFDGEVYIKTSIFPLFRAFTSQKDVSGNWMAKPGLGTYHNLLEQMENNGIDEIYHESAFKMVKKSKNFRNSETGLYDQPMKKQTLQNRFWRLQVENPSGKTEIVDGTQLIQLIDSEMFNDEPVTYKGQSTTLGAIRDDYQRMLADVRLDSMTKATKFLDIMVDGKSAFIDKIVRSLETSGTDNNTIEFFQQFAKDSKEFKYSTDLPNVNNKFQELFLSHFTKSVFRQKAPGNKFSLVSASGYEIEDSVTKQMRPLQIHKVVDEKLQYAEVVISEELLHNYGLTRRDFDSAPQDVQDELLTMIGFRIPTQSHHSMMPFKVVGWLPAYYGSVVIAPSEITYLSGADYDVDSLFVVRKEFRKYKHKGRQVIEAYGATKTTEQLWSDFLDYEFTHNKDLRSVYRQMLANDEGYQDILSALAQYKMRLGEYKDIRTDAIGRLESEDLTGEEREAIVGEIDRFKNAVGEGLKSFDFDSFQEVLLAKSDTETFFREKALQLFDMSSNMEEFAKLPKGLQLTNGARYNEMFDARLAFLHNPKIWESLFTPASMDSLKAIAGNIASITKKREDSPIPYNWSSSRLSHWLNNAVGKANVGNAANANLTSAFLTKYETRLKEPIMFDKNVYTGFTSNEEQDIDFIYDENDVPVDIAPTPIIRRKADSLSTIVSAMTDNAKERLAAKLNLTQDNLSTFSNMVAMGMGLNRTMLFANQPVLIELTKRIIATKSIIDGAPAFQIAQKLLDSMGGENHYEFTSKELLDNLKEPSNKVQAAVLTKFIQLNKLTGQIGKVTRILSTNKTIGIDFATLDNILQADAEVNDESFALEISRAMAEDFNMIQNIQNARRVRDIAPQYFLSRTLPFQVMFTETLRQGVDDDSVKNATTDFVTFLGMQNLNKVFEQKFGTPIKDLQYLLEGENNIVVQFKNTLRDNPELKKNLLMKQLIARNPEDKDNKNPFYRLEYNGRSNTDPKFVEKLADSYRELTAHANPKVREFAGNMLRYLIIKDNLKFLNNSFIRLIDPQFLDTYSKTLKSVKELFSVNFESFEEFFKTFYGKSYQDMNTLFQQEYFSNYEHAKELRSLNVSRNTLTANAEGVFVSPIIPEGGEQDQSKLDRLPKFFKKWVSPQGENPGYYTVWQLDEVIWDEARYGAQYKRLYINGNTFQQPYHNTNLTDVYHEPKPVKPGVEEVGEKTVESLWNEYKSRILARDSQASLEDFQEAAAERGVKWLEDYLKKCY